MKGFRTLGLNLVAALVGVMMSTDWLTITDPRTAGMIVGGLGLANTVLRVFTDGPIGGTRPPA